jgi:hypothetical protein
MVTGSGLQPMDLKLKTGDKARVTFPKTDKRGMSIIKDCSVVAEYERFIVFDNGRYRETLDKFDISKGSAKVERRGR